MNKDMLEAFSILERRFYKILKVNLKDNTYKEIKLSKEDDSCIKEDFREWILNFVSLGYIHEQDRTNFLRILDYKSLQETPVSIYYRRRFTDTQWHWVCLETEFCQDKNCVMIYVRDAQDGYTLSIQKNLQYKSEHDAMTGLCNKGKFLETCIQYNKELPYLKSVGVLYADLNDLKEINDNQGHVAGDKYICSFSKILKQTFRLSNCFRVGGDEFIVLLKNIEEDVFYNRIDKIIKEINNQSIRCALGYEWISPCSLKNLFLIETVIEKAEKKMYLCKRTLKNYKKG